MRTPKQREKALAGFVDRPQILICAQEKEFAHSVLARRSDSS
jgi:hypothetical protein